MKYVKTSGIRIENSLLIIKSGKCVTYGSELYINSGSHGITKKNLQITINNNTKLVSSHNKVVIKTVTITKRKNFLERRTEINSTKTEGRKTIVHFQLTCKAKYT